MTFHLHLVPKEEVSEHGVRVVAFVILGLLLDPALLLGPYGLPWRKAGFKFHPCYLPG